MTADNELLSQYADSGSDAAFNELVSRNLDLVYATAVRLVGDPHRAQDVAQLVFIDLARKAGSLRRHPTLVSWLYVSTRYAAQKIIRAEQRRVAREEEVHAMQMISAPDPLPNWDNLRPILDDVLHELSDRDRQVVLLRYFRGLRFAEVAAALGMNEGAARMRIDRALEKMNTLLVRRGIGSTSSALGIALASQPAFATPAGLAATISGSALAAVSAGHAFGLLSLMTAQKSALPLGFAALLGLLSLGVGFHQWGELQAVQSALATASQRHAVGKQQLQEWQGRLATAEQAAAELQRAGPRGPAAAALQPGPAPAANKAGGVNGKPEWEAFAAAHPEARGIMIEKFRDQLRLNNRLLFLQAGMTPAQVDEILTRAAEYMVNERLGIVANTDLPVEAGQVQFANREDLLRTVLSDSQIQDIKKFSRMGPAGSWLNDLRSATIAAGTRISPSQEIQLAEVIASHSPAYQRGATWNRNSMDWGGAYQQAATVLSPAQWKASEGFFLTLEYRQAVDEGRQNQGARMPVGPVEKQP